MNAAAGSRQRKRFVLPGSNQTTTVIVLVVCAIGFLVLLYVSFSLIRRCWGRKSVPLPPVQPSAYQRQQLAQVAEQNIVSLTPTYPSRLSTPRDSSPCRSDFSLPLSKEVGTPSPSRRFSALPDTLPSGNVMLTDSPTFSAPGGQADDRFISRASIYDGRRRSSGSSIGSGSLVPPSTIHSSTSAYGPPSVARRTRLQSTTSRHTTNRHTIVGLPHSPHSPVQIVLPAPLAHALTPYISGSRSTENIRDLGAPDSRGHTRLSVADQWTHALHQSESDGHLYSTRVAGRRPATASLSRLKTSSSIHHTAPTSLGPRDLSVFPSSPLVPVEYNAGTPS